MLQYIPWAGKHSVDQCNSRLTSFPVFSSKRAFALSSRNVTFATLILLLSLTPVGAAIVCPRRLDPYPGRVILAELELPLEIVTLCFRSQRAKRSNASRMCGSRSHRPRAQPEVSSPSPGSLDGRVTNTFPPDVRSILAGFNRFSSRLSCCSSDGDFSCLSDRRGCLPRLRNLGLCVANDQNGNFHHAGYADVRSRVITRW